MSDLENELRRFVPTPPPASLDARIARDLAIPAEARRVVHQSPVGDRLLRGTLTLAAASLMLIVALLTEDHLRTRPFPPDVMQASSSPAFTQSRLLLAQLPKEQSP